MADEVSRALRAVLVARTAASGGVRVVYPFIPAIARGLGVPIEAVAGLVALRNLGGFAAPVAARVSEVAGRRLVMVGSMVAVVLGCALTAATSSFALAAAGMLLVGIAKPAFDLAMQAWFGDRVPYLERGRVFGITELTWALSLLVFVPVSGLLIEATSWRAPFVLVAVAAVAGTITMLRGVVADRPHRGVKRPLEMTSPRVAILVVSFLFSVAAEIPFVAYAKWLEDSFGLTVAGIGAFTIVLVVAELLGEGAVVLFADRLGLRRMVSLGLLVSALAYVCFAFADASLVIAIVLVTAWIAAFEVTIVAVIPFVTELAIGARDRMLSLMSLVFLAGRALGALVALGLYFRGGIALVGAVSAVLCLGAAIVMVKVPEPRTRPAELVR